MRLRLVEPKPSMQAQITICSQRQMLLLSNMFLDSTNKEEIGGSLPKGNDQDFGPPEVQVLLQDAAEVVPAEVQAMQAGTGDKAEDKVRMEDSL